MSEIRGSIWRPIAALTVLGAVCGVVALGVFQWWWKSLASPHILTGGSYREPFSEPTYTGPIFMDLFPAEPAPWLYSGLVLGPTVVACSPGSCSWCSSGVIVRRTARLHRTNHQSASNARERRRGSANGRSAKRSRTKTLSSPAILLTFNVLHSTHW